MKPAVTPISGRITEGTKARMILFPNKDLYFLFV